MKKWWVSIFLKANIYINNNNKSGIYLRVYLTKWNCRFIILKSCAIICVFDDEDDNK